LFDIKGEFTRITAAYKHKTSSTGKTTMLERRTFTGLLYLVGEFKAGHVKVKEFLNETFGLPAFRATIIITCFETVTLCTLLDKSFRIECKMLLE
jgi:hypothetical protein